MVADMDNGPIPPPHAPPAPGDPTPLGTQPDRHRSRAGQVTTGVILIVLGALFFADRLGWQFGWQWHPTFSHMWPVLLIVMGLSRIMSGDDTPRYSRSGRRRGGGRFWGGGWILIVGVIMLLDQNRWLPLSQSWPLFIIAGGLSMLLERGRGGN